MTKPASDRLFDRSGKYGSSPTAVSLSDIAKIPLENEFVKDIVECLQSNDAFELKIGLWFAQGVLDSNPPLALLEMLVAGLDGWMHHESADIRATALPLLVRLRDNVSGYRSMMLECLKDANPAVRSMALAEHATFLKRNDIKVLLKFEADDFAMEIGMGGPLIYTIRNQALAVIEQLSGFQFVKHENAALFDNGCPVYWLDWKPFLEDWNGRKTG